MLAAVLAAAAAAGLGVVAADFPRRDAQTASYPHYPKRTVYSLSGAWAFQFLNHTDYNATDATIPPSVTFEGTLQVPSAWDAQWGTGLQYSRGAGFYKSTLPIPAGHPARLHFEACSIFCRVFVDGKVVAANTLGGFTPFWVDIPPAPSSSSRELVVMASNVFEPLRNDSTSLTPTQAEYYDFYQYGGIIREVTLHVLPSSGPALTRVAVTPLSTGYLPDAGLVLPSGEVDLNVTVLDAATVNGGGAVVGLCWDVAATAASCQDMSTHELTGSSTVIRSLAVPNFQLWSPDSPKLHTVTVLLLGSADDTQVPAGAVDGIQVRFGLRNVRTNGRHIQINGVDTKLKGFNRHDMYPQIGPTLTDALIDADIDLITTLKANFIRGSHYPQDPRFLDRCDEHGVLVWEEALAWGNYAAVLTNPDFLAASVGTAHAMVDRDYNHPAVIIWAFFNEGQSDNNASVPSYAKMAATFRGRDSTRLVTWADNRGDRGKAYEHADIVSNNYYPGWYNGPASGINETWSSRAAWAAAAYPHKPFMISETGAGGIWGQHSQNASRWSLEYQVVVDAINARTAMQDPSIAGLALWQFCDIKVDAANTSTNRPGGINNKGVLSLDRHPKPAATNVSAAYAAAPPPVG